MRKLSILIQLPDSNSEIYREQIRKILKLKNLMLSLLGGVIIESYCTLHQFGMVSLAQRPVNIWIAFLHGLLNKINKTKLTVAKLYKEIILVFLIAQDMKFYLFVNKTNILHQLMLSAIIEINYYIFI